MSITIDWPDELRPAMVDWGLYVPQLMGRSAFDGSVQSNTLGAPRWQFTIETGPLKSELVPQWEAFIDRLRGRVNRVRAHDWRREAPLGVASGTPLVRTSGSGAALETKGWTPNTAGILLAGSYIGVNEGAGVNLLAPYGDFQTDSDTDGVANGWALYSGGTTGSLSDGLVAGGTGNLQRVNVPTLGATTSDQAGVRYANYAEVVGGQKYTLAADVRVTSGVSAKLGLGIAWYTATPTLLSAVFDYTQALSSTSTRKSFTWTAPAAAVKAQAYVFVHSQTAGGALSFDIDNAQLEHGLVATPFSNVVAATGGIGELKRLTQDMDSDASGFATAAFEPPLRLAPAVDAPLALVKPTARFVMTTESPSMSQRGARHPGFTLGFDEVFL